MCQEIVDENEIKVAEIDLWVIITVEDIAWDGDSAERRKKGSSEEQNLNKRQTREREQPKDILKEKLEMGGGGGNHPPEYGVTETN